MLLYSVVHIFVDITHKSEHAQRVAADDVNALVFMNVSKRPADARLNIWHGHRFYGVRKLAGTATALTSLGAAPASWVISTSRGSMWQSGNGVTE
jgi:hypothetical protein